MTPRVFQISEHIYPEPQYHTWEFDQIGRHWKLELNETSKTNPRLVLQRRPLDAAAGNQWRFSNIAIILPNPFQILIIFWYSVECWYWNTSSAAEHQVEVLKYYNNICNISWTLGHFATNGYPADLFVSKILRVLLRFF